MRSRYQISTTKKEKRSKLNFKRVLKQIKREKGSKVTEEDDEMFPVTTRVLCIMIVE
jgi:hypothetical protein